ncbi:mechanosensitive ion channel family protein, partial [Bacteroidota bacterium]
MNNFLTDFDFGQLWEQIVVWVITTLPGILLILLIGYISLRTWKFFIRKTSKLLRERAAKIPDEDTEEAGKRIDTLMGIMRVAGRLTIWGIILMLLLQKLNVNIAPLLAGLGIFGLAVGFGAQELVRDVVSGFFMLLENQVRKGDIAVINGTGGLVESISLRTITLRDVSGTVHIFQNGKINSLSNMTKEWSAMVFDVGIAYKENTDLVVEIMKRVGEELMEDVDY